MYFCKSERLLCKGMEKMSCEDIINTFNVCIQEYIQKEQGAICENNCSIEVLEYLRKSDNIRSELPTT